VATVLAARGVPGRGQTSAPPLPWCLLFAATSEGQSSFPLRFLAPKHLKKIPKKLRLFESDLAAHVDQWTCEVMPTLECAWKCAAWSVVTSLPQPLLAVPAFMFVEAFQALLPFGMGFAAVGLPGLGFSGPGFSVSGSGFRVKLTGSTRECPRVLVH